MPRYTTDSDCSEPETAREGKLRSGSVPHAVPRPAGQSTIPSSIGGYHVISAIGAGGMAQVYLCQARGIGGFNKLVVVKTPRAEVLHDVDTVEMFLNEARIAGRLNHPNVVHTHDVGMRDGVPFMAMEYLEGRSLSEVQRRIGLEQLSTDLQLRIISNALAGLHYAHELEDYDGTGLRIVHRDISPQNVFVTFGGVTKLLDFGIAKAAGSVSFTREGVLKGKLAYMAPEQGALLSVDLRADIFSMGVMIWEAVTHRRLVPLGSDELSVHIRRVSGADPGVRDVAPDAPAELVAICARAMAVSPADRYQTALELKHAIDEYLLNSSRPADGDIGRLVSEAFAEDRVAARTEIDKRRMGSLSPPPHATPSVPPDHLEASNAATTVDTSDASELAPVKAPKRAAIGVLAGFLVLATAGAITTLVVSRRREDTAAASSIPRPASPLPLPASARVDPSLQETRKIRVTLRATPTISELDIDGERVTGSTFDEEVDASPIPHRIRASAAGFVPQEQIVTFDRDVRVDIALVQAAQPRGVAPAPPSAPKSEPAAAPKPSLRPIDDKDPYR